MENAKKKRARRVLLFMPGDSLKKITKGAGLDVDAVIMDLEDGVALSQKEAARETVHEALLSIDIDFGHTERWVRVNPAGLGLQDLDLANTIAGKPDGYVLPKVESASDVQRVSDALYDYEIRLDYEVGGICLIAIIESALGIVNLKEIASADSRLVALAFGAEDFSSSIGAIRSVGLEEVLYARSAVVTHAAAYNLQALDTPYTDIQNIDGLIRETRQAMEMGYSGKLAIHPRHIEPIVNVFMPSDEDLEAARTLIEAFKTHQNSGTGVFNFQGKMIDMPMIRAAERILKRANIDA